MSDEDFGKARRLLRGCTTRLDHESPFVDRVRDSENASLMATSSPDQLAADEQQEKLRRFVDDWRSHVWEELERLDSSSSKAAARDVGDVNEDPIIILIKPHDGASVLDLIDTDNVPFNKLMIVLAHDCLQICHWRQQVISKFYPRLVVFGLPSNSEEVLEGELQKSFANSFSFFQELLEVISKLRAVLSNLVQQLEAIFSGDGSRSSNRPFASFWNVRLQTVVLSLAEGFAILVTIDEIVAQNSAVGHALSLFTRMLHAARSDPAGFEMEPEQVESLDREVTRMDGLLMGGLFQRCVQEDFYGHLDMQKLKMNRRCLEEISLCTRRALQQILPRLGERKHLDALDLRPVEFYQMDAYLERDMDDTFVLKD